MNTHDSIRAIKWRDNALYLLDQRQLPDEEQYLKLSDCRSVAHAIADMVVRGAPAIGITAAYAVLLSAIEHYSHSPQNWKAAMQDDLHFLSRSRPTAINLFWAINRMQAVMDAQSDDQNPVGNLMMEASAIHEEDLESNYHMGEMGASLITGNCDVLTHCNTGSLATGGFGTALGVIRTAYRQGLISHVYADETRPWLQGARLTAWELQKDSIPVSLLVDNAASHLMKQGLVKWVIVGSDRIAANGDVANKIGTYQLAISARYHNVKFMVVAPTSTVDMNVASGDDIPIEDRSSEEVVSLQGLNIAPSGVTAINPAFDVTPAELVDAIVTERGVVLTPTEEKMAVMMQSIGAQ